MDDSSLGLVMTQTRDNGFQALRILGKHYVGCSKPRIITYHQLTAFKKKESESVTGFIIRVECAASALKAAN